MKDFNIKPVVEEFKQTHKLSRFTPNGSAVYVAKKNGSKLIPIYSPDVTGYEAQFYVSMPSVLELMNEIRDYAEMVETYPGELGEWMDREFDHCMEMVRCELYGYYEDLRVKYNASKAKKRA